MRLKSAESWLDDELSQVPLMAVIHSKSPRQTVALAESAWNIGIRHVEVTLQSADNLPALRAAVDAAAERDLGVGAGTITTLERAEAAWRAGVSFTVSPGLDSDMVRASMRAAIPHLPGVATATEIRKARALGLTWMKTFPAQSLGVDWFAEMRRPFAGVSFVVTGGLRARNAHRFLNAGANVIAVTSSLQDKRELEALAELIRCGATQRLTSVE
jgi:2-dehydro-3-deoxyphosphogluconate aldolase/(4S)-4-hydroxy-2-oxoglutarate aldolase